jgi:hypothetical protein
MRTIDFGPTAVSIPPYFSPETFETIICCDDIGINPSFTSTSNEDKIQDFLSWSHTSGDYTPDRAEIVRTMLWQEQSRVFEGRIAQAYAAGEHVRLVQPPRAKPVRQPYVVRLLKRRNPTADLAGSESKLPGGEDQFFLPLNNRGDMAYEGGRVAYQPVNENSAWVYLGTPDSWNARLSYVEVPKMVGCCEWHGFEYEIRLCVQREE